MEAQKPKSSAWIFGALFVSALLAGLWLGLRLGGKRGEEGAGRQDLSAINLPEAPLQEPAPLPIEAQLPAEEEERVLRVPGTEPPQAVAPGRTVEAPQGEQRLREREFVRRYCLKIAYYEGRMMRLMVDKYWRHYPVVRQIDKEFAQLDRYMALKRQYEKDKDFYNFVRGSVALPEVRKLVRKHSTNPKVWEVGPQILFEVVRRPPPKPIEAELQRFLSEDPKVSRFLSQELLPAVASMAAKLGSQGMNMASVQAVLGLLRGGASAPAADRKRPARGR